MQPKKKGMETPIVYGIFLILVLFIALHGAVAYKIAQSMVAVGELEKTKTTLTVINLLCDRIATHPTEIIINEYTKQWLLWGGFGWLIVVLMLESNHKNFIQGKEFGTAKWGTLSDIKDLFASTIEASEIKKAKATRTKLGRWSQIISEVWGNGETEATQMLSQEIRFSLIGTVTDIQTISVW